MILVGKHNKAARYFPSLEDVKHGQAFRYWQAVVQLVMNYLLVDVPLGDILTREQVTRDVAHP